MHRFFQVYREEQTLLRSEIKDEFQFVEEIRLLR